MPEPYQDDPQSSAFLEQFLSVMETPFVDIEQAIDSIGEYFDPNGAPSESLSWLEEWLAADIGREWPESARRDDYLRVRSGSTRGTRPVRRPVSGRLRRLRVDGYVGTLWRLTRSETKLLGRREPSVRFQYVQHGVVVGVILSLNPQRKLNLLGRYLRRSYSPLRKQALALDPPAPIIQTDAALRTRWAYGLQSDAGKGI